MTNSSLVAAIIEADTQRYRAMIERDLPALDRVLADDMVYMHSKGAIDTKESLMAALQEGKFTFKSAETSDVSVRAYGAAAILHGKVTLVVDVGGVEHVAHNSFTTVWVCQDGDWRLAHWQATPLPKN